MQALATRLHSRRATVVLAVIVCLVAVACSDGGDSPPPTPTTPAPEGGAVVTVEMTDHAYTVSGPLAERGTLRLVNAGAQLHMLALGKMKAGATLADLDAALRQRGEPAMADFVDVLGFPGAVLSPGTTVEVTAPNLGPGSYAMVCFVPTEGAGIPHFHNGMVGQLEVFEGDPPPQPIADGTWRIGPGLAMAGPNTLPAGRRTLRIEATPGSGHLEPRLTRLGEGATPFGLDAAFRRVLSPDPVPPPGAAAGIDGQLVFGGRDLDGVHAFYLTTDLVPGEYVVAVQDALPTIPPPPPPTTTSTVPPPSTAPPAPPTSPPPPPPPPPSLVVVRVT